MGSSKGSGDGGGVGGGTAALGTRFERCGSISGRPELFEFSGRKQRNEARVRVCGQTHPGLTFLGSIAVRQPLAIWISFFVNLLLRIHF